MAFSSDFEPCENAKIVEKIRQNKIKIRLFILLMISFEKIVSRGF
jgi:hypothetical protein